MTGKRKKILRTILIITTLSLVVTSFLGYKYYNYLFKPNIDMEGKKSTYVYIPTGSDYKIVLNILKKDKSEKENIYKTGINEIRVYSSENTGW